MLFNSEQIVNKVNSLNKSKTYLILVNFLLAFFLLIFSNIGALPFNNSGDFAFAVFVVLILALYRPGWAFLFFIGTIALENINLAPENVGLIIRPFQLLGVATVISLIIRYFSGRLNFKLPKFLWQDWIVLIFSVAGFASSLGAENMTLAIKLSVVIVSFAVFYFLIRVFVQSVDDIKKILPFFLGSSVVIVLYGIWQNWQFMNGGNHFEVMPGRPNSTFTEADWLGIFLVLVLAITYSLIYSKALKLEFEKLSKKFAHTLPCWIMIILTYTLLIITVSRSAWLGAVAMTIVFATFIVWRKKYEALVSLAATFILSLIITFSFNLTDFELRNRIQSTGSGLQEITVSCNPKFIAPPEVIESTQELGEIGCRHINLEDIEKEENTGRNIYKIYRKDPNVSIRAEIYKKSWEEIKKHPILGIGWGNIQNTLGADGRGAGLNSSNIFLEVWLGSGILGLISFVVVLGSIFYRGARNIVRDNDNIFGLFIVLSFFAIIIPNLFNAGIMLGFLWVWIGIVQARRAWPRFVFVTVSLDTAAS